MDIEAELVQAFEALTGEESATRVPKPAPARFIHVRRKGGSTNGARGDAASVFRDKPLIDVMVSAEDEDAAVALADQIEAFMLTAVQTQPFTVPCYEVDQFIRAWSDDDLDGVFIAPRVWLSYRMSLRKNM
ncbi:hypothetical protein ACFQS3_02645 [Glycomyces mayteni]|uniref:Tail terminator n=1 Tax=Glycomyces mayteni TaxID=543887 RepID=A0ABW2D5C9_9ACTN|nr:hypothetical protein GCM10025732_48290 [Glycomyces mayteni]